MSTNTRFLSSARSVSIDSWKSAVNDILVLTTEWLLAQTISTSEPMLGRCASLELPAYNLKALGVRLVTNPLVAQLAKNAGFDSVFIDLEHSTLSIADAGNISSAALSVGITPFVRVPHQCGNGFVQKVLDAGAMGIIFPHVSSSSEAQAAVKICKYPPVGYRSMTGLLPVFSLQATKSELIIEESNSSASSVLVMIESQEAVERADEIAAVKGVDVLLIGSNDLAIELGVPGGFRTDIFRSALDTISKACKKHGKIMGLAGIYDQQDIHEWAIRSLGVRYMLCQQDSGLIVGAGAKCAAAVPNSKATNGVEN